MEGKASDWRPGPTVCRCCLNEGCYKDISTEYFWMGKREVYAEMLSETLNVSIAYSKSGGPNSNSRLICEQCIGRLRDASEFKRQVIDCEKTFMHHLDPGNSSGSQEFNVESIGEVKVEMVKREKELSDDDFDDRPDFLDVDTDDDLDDQPLTKLASKVPKKESVDLLDLLDSSQITVKRKSNTKVKEPPKKMVKIVKKKEIAIKPSASKATPAKQAEKKKENDAHTKRNAELVLQYSSLYPFRLQGKTLICVYCCDRFEDPDEYRSHMDKTHSTVNLYTAFAHTGKSRGRDYLKVDCVNLKCNLCEESIDTVAEVAQHLKDSHDEYSDIKDMNLQYEVGLHPYRLMKDKWICMVCNMKLPTLTKLTRHMSSHYADYVCDICGKSYMNIDNLKYHVKFSHSEKHLCRRCKKEFSTPEERKEHLKSSKKCRPFACVHCGERFSSWEQKQVHLISKHDVQAVTYPCPDCEIVFNTRKRFYDHYTIAHSDLAFQCSCCDKKFRHKGLLEDHLVIHTGEKQFKCTACSKTFTRNKALRQHMWMHSEKKRFACISCDKTFNQKVSFKSHMKNVHADISINL